MSGFTGILARIAEVAGEAAATRLALKAGGTEMKFSASPKGALAKIVGAEAARQIVDDLGPEKHTIPMAHLRGQKGRRAAAAQMIAQKASTNEIARTLDVHERTVRRVRKKMKSDVSLPFFDDED